MEWHRALKAVNLDGKDPDEVIHLFKKEAELFSRRERSALIPDALNQRIYQQADLHELPQEWFTSQIEAAHHFYGPQRFATGGDLKQFLEDAVVPQGYLIAKLADVAHRWQLPQVSDLAIAFFLVKRLVHLKDDLLKDQLFIPMGDLALAGVTVDDLKQGNNNEQTQKMLWKQVIRIRDAFAQGQPLIRDLPRKFRRSFKKNWLTGLEFVSEIERRDYDLWSARIALSGMQKFQINVLSIISQGAGRARGR